MELEIVEPEPKVKVCEPWESVENPGNVEKIYEHLKRHGSISMPEGEDLYHVHRLASVIFRVKQRYGVQIKNRGRQMGFNYGIYFMAKE
jgi:hypothetical protein